MPEKYAERPPTVEAIQFVGDPDSAAQINNWLSSFGTTVMHDTVRNRLVLQTASGNFLTVENSDWVMLNSNLTLSNMKHADFDIKYAAVTPPADPVV